MARPPKPKMDYATFRCLDEDLLFTAKVEYLGHDVEEPGGAGHFKWTIGKVRGVTCPNDPTHRIELVEE